MGVWGLKTFHDRNGASRTVNIEHEIRMWKSRNPNETPIIVFDILAYCNMFDGYVCGGNSMHFDANMEKFFIRLTENGVKLVFIQNLAVEIARENLWMIRRNEEFENYAKIYEDIDNDDSPKSSWEIVEMLREESSAYKVSTNLIPIASKYGEYRFTRPGRDCDYEVASYAKKHNAMAILTADTDFLIFDGYFKLWMIKEIDYVNFTVTEYDRLVMNRLLGLTFEQRPLFATLAGNDFTSQYYEQLKPFHWKLISGYRTNQTNCTSEFWADKFPAISKFIRDDFPNVLTPDDVANLARRIFGKNVDEEKRRLIVDSIRSYDLTLDDEDVPIEDPIVSELKKMSINSVRFYLKLSTNTTRTLTTTFNDMISAEFSEILIGFMVELLRKKVGVLDRDRNAHEFKLIAKKSRNEPYAIHREIAIHPEGPMPDLFDLLTKDESDQELNEIRWNLLAWMLSIPVQQRDALRAMEKQFRIPCATLLALVQRNILTVRAADGILITVVAIERGTHVGKSMPHRLNAYYVRAAHTYRTVHGKIMEAYFAAGLFAYISDLFQFDGIYYQDLMKSDAFSADLIKSIQPYRIYISPNCFFAGDFTFPNLKSFASKFQIFTFIKFRFVCTFLYLICHILYLLAAKIFKYKEQME